MRSSIVLAGLLALILCFSDQTHAASGERPAEYRELSELKRGQLSDEEKEEMEAYRPQVQKDAATAAAIKAGARWRYQQIIKEVVEPNAAELDALFNFSPLLIRRDEITAAPPIVTRAGAALRVGDDGKVKVQKGSYQFVKSAAIMTGVPTWRNYLYFDVGQDDEIHPSILPADSRELTKWRKWVDEGWQLGVEQAEALFDSNVARLVRDFNGMLTYYSLSSVGMIEKPVISKTESGTIIKAKEVIQDLDLYEMTRDGRFIKPPAQNQTKKAPAKKVRTAKSAAPAEVKNIPADGPHVPLPPSVRPLTAQEAGCLKAGSRSADCGKKIEPKKPAEGSR